ncbi:40838_t:CDS:2 [Gigaspora margarita]|uniref:40838_t:CDS:1 n=1 Tax=Gigaspora margarita TaxID=4874 RepID=A0ABN7VW91_GIGMA|nr:40838_t:CDS:2 [Gigaspora margarita]
MNSDDSNTNTANTNTSKFVVVQSLTPQNYLFQTQKSKSLSDSSYNQNKKSQNLVQDNYPYIYIIRIMSQRKTNYTYRIISLGFYSLNATKTRHNSINGTVFKYQMIIHFYEIQKCTSYNSATDVSNKFLQKLGKSNKSSISGVKLFAFDLEYQQKPLKKQYNSQKKPLEELSSLQINRRLRSLANDIKDNVQSLFLKYNMTSLETEKVDL